MTITDDTGRRAIIAAALAVIERNPRVRPQIKTYPYLDGFITGVNLLMLERAGGVS